MRCTIVSYLADPLSKGKRDAEALPYLEKLVQEFEKSEFQLLGQKKPAHPRRTHEGTSLARWLRQRSK